ncbi:hypothetical protein BSKO_04681 [Bryopsis sp. KO-2023]|nr:hypothetical protein BSKO_04681 [Bryopsis sp. KO-2023]
MSHLEMVVNKANKNAFAGANLGVPCSPMEAVTSLDPKDYVWNNPLLNWQPPIAGLVPGRPLGTVPPLAGLVGPPPVSPQAFFPGLGTFPWCGMQGVCLPPAIVPAVPAMPPISQVPVQNASQPMPAPQQQLLNSMVPVERPAHLASKADPQPPLPATNACNGGVSTTDLLECCMEDDELRRLLEDPLDVAFEGLASDSSNASCFTADTSSPKPSNVGLDTPDDDFFSLAGLDFSCFDPEDSYPNVIPVDSGMGARHSRPVPKGPGHWGVKKKRSVRQRKTDVKSLGSGGGDAGDVALIDLGDVLWDVNTRALPSGTGRYTSGAKCGTSKSKGCGLNATALEKRKRTRTKA